MSLMFADAEGKKVAQSPMEHLRHSHSKGVHDIEPWMYAHWTDSLIQTVSECDPRFTEQLGKEWRLCFNRAIEFIKRGYEHG